MNKVSAINKIVSGKSNKILRCAFILIIFVWILSVLIYWHLIGKIYDSKYMSGLELVVKLADQEKCSRPVAFGKQIYTVTTNDIPQITQIIVDPLDVDFGEVQTITAEINDSNGNPIAAVNCVGRTDNDSFHFSLKLISGDELDGAWQGFWSPQDTFCDNYAVSIIPVSASGESNVTLTFR